ncbi:RNA-binding (RRM/RBD/RNP motifs) family protein [Actinidia rufa]|uniref:RNA-binding (RRM/RBD/RNP motifs) family protein n=1 Tax=Actinidia rufa TaxID=165716 RepID=A0A7J0D8S3_9ERIC|nr:RNA-binding (RRM/RBD/RNP motifs) family protein [Actinidia rufa]
MQQEDRSATATRKPICRRFSSPAILKERRLLACFYGYASTSIGNAFLTLLGRVSVALLRENRRFAVLGGIRPPTARFLQLRYQGVVSAKVIRNKQTSQSEGYGFIEFVSHAAAERTLQAYNGTLMPNVEQNYRLNWASFGAGEKRSDGTPDFTIFVGDLASDVTDYILQETFRAHYPSVRGAKVVNDRLTGRTKGYGFVKFGEESEQLRAMTEMNGKVCSTRPMRIGPAANKKNVDKASTFKFMSFQYLPFEILAITTYECAWFHLASYQNSQGTLNENDPTNTTIFVGGLNNGVLDEQLRQIFSPYGQLVHVKIPSGGKGCGFVQFAERQCAEEALRMLNGNQLGGTKIRLSWGRSPSNKQAQVDPNQWNSGYYGYAQGYETYGYAAAAQDPNLYYGSYPGYGNYQQPPQQQQQQQSSFPM